MHNDDDSFSSKSTIYIYQDTLTMYINCYLDEPDDQFNQGNDGGCVQVNGVLQGRWNEFPCQHMRAGLCQKKCGKGSSKYKR